MGYGPHVCSARESVYTYLVVCGLVTIVAIFVILFLSTRLFHDHMLASDLKLRGGSPLLWEDVASASTSALNWSYQDLPRLSMKPSPTRLRPISTPVTSSASWLLGRAYRRYPQSQNL